MTVDWFRWDFGHLFGLMVIIDRGGDVGAEYEVSETALMKNNDKTVTWYYTTGETKDTEFYSRLETSLWLKSIWKLVMCITSH